MLDWLDDDSTLLVREMKMIEQRLVEKRNSAERKEKIRFIDNLSHEEFQELLEVWSNYVLAKKNKIPRKFIVRKYQT